MSDEVTVENWVTLVTRRSYPATLPWYTIDPTAGSESPAPLSVTTRLLLIAMLNSAAAGAAVPSRTAAVRSSPPDALESTRGNILRPPKRAIPEYRRALALPQGRVEGSQR